MDTVICLKFTIPSSDIPQSGSGGRQSISLPWCKKQTVIYSVHLQTLSNHTLDRNTICLGRISCNHALGPASCHITLKEQEQSWTLWPLVKVEWIHPMSPDSASMCATQCSWCMNCGGLMPIIMHSWWMYWESIMAVNQNKCYICCGELMSIVENSWCLYCDGFTL